jgi:hypothetical protein
MQISVKSNTDKIIRGLNTFERQFVPKAMNASLNKVGTGVNTLVVRDVAKQAGVKQMDLKRRGFFSRFRSNVKTLTFSVVIRWGAIPLKDFSPVQTPQGVVAKAWGVKTLYDKAFKSETLGNHVFVRKTSNRLPIKKLYGPIPARLAASSQTEQRVGDLVADRMPRELARNLTFYIRRALGSV